MSSLLTDSQDLVTPLMIRENKVSSCNLRAENEFQNTNNNESARGSVFVYTCIMHGWVANETFVLAGASFC